MIFLHFMKLSLKWSKTFSIWTESAILTITKSLHIVKGTHWNTWRSAAKGLLCIMRNKLSSWPKTNGSLIKRFTTRFREFSFSSNTRFQKILRSGKIEWNDTTWNKCQTCSAIIYFSHSSTPETAFCKLEESPTVSSNQRTSCPLIRFSRWMQGYFCKTHWTFWINPSWWK